MFRSTNLIPSYEAPGEVRFAMFHYITNDALAEVLAPGYFASPMNRLRPGDMILCATGPVLGTTFKQVKATPIRRALLMVQAVAPQPAVRLVLDYGGLEDEAARQRELEKARRVRRATLQALAVGGRGLPPRRMRLRMGGAAR